MIPLIDAYDYDLEANSTKYGGEFLAWLLWYGQETESLTIREGKEDVTVEVGFGEKLILGKMSSTITFQGRHASSAPEVYQALRRGCTLYSLELTITKTERQWTCTLGDTLDLSSVKCPTILSKQDEEPFFEMMFLIEELEGMLSAIFNEFLKVRLDDEEWQKTSDSIRKYFAS